MMESQDGLLNDEPDSRWSCSLNMDSTSSTTVGCDITYDLQASYDLDSIVICEWAYRGYVRVCRLSSKSFWYVCFCIVLLSSVNTECERSGRQKLTIGRQVPGSDDLTWIFCVQTAPGAGQRAYDAFFASLPSHFRYYFSAVCRSTLSHGHHKYPPHRLLSEGVRCALG